MPRATLADGRVVDIRFPDVLTGIERMEVDLRVRLQPEQARRMRDNLAPLCADLEALALAQDGLNRALRPVQAAFIRAQRWGSLTRLEPLPGEMDVQLKTVMAACAILEGLGDRGQTPISPRGDRGQAPISRQGEFTWFHISQFVCARPTGDIAIASAQAGEMLPLMREAARCVAAVAERGGRLLDVLTDAQRAWILDDKMRRMAALKQEQGGVQPVQVMELVTRRAAEE